MCARHKSHVTNTFESIILAVSTKAINIIIIIIVRRISYRKLIHANVGHAIFREELGAFLICGQNRVTRIHVSTVSP